MEKANPANPKKVNKFKAFFRNVFSAIASHRMMTIITFVLILVISIIIWTISAASNVIVGGGSTSVSAIMADITEQYRRDSGSDVLYNSLGSAAALVGVKNGSYEFGLLSEDVHSTPIDGDNGTNAQNLWNNNGINRFVFARDYIVLFYNLPNGCFLSDNDKPLTFSEFGLNENGNPEPGTKAMQQIYSQNATWKSVFGNQLTCTNDAPFYTITREAGSGTRSFFESSVIYKKDYSTNEVASSNGAMFQSVTRTPGSFGYISFSFIEQVADKLGKNRIAAVINPIISPDPQVPFIETPEGEFLFNSMYSLNRPFTGIVNTNSSQLVPTLKFLAWMLDPIPYAKTLKDSKFYDPTYELGPHDAAYWYILEGEEPLAPEDHYFQKYNNNTKFALSGETTLTEPYPWDFKQNYLSIWDLIRQKIPNNNYQDLKDYEYEG
ncbi:phosphate ABC transporter substrate-binding protein [Spiroplasma syrphidicola EA-1]|uniref:Phosphate ABC transporter substrate-binding protein n=1 Tax=Spiroplasma syrphidicola EA-1 TaxID=1276229 RepID=R4UD88_9MOLU|nr:phosphate ABC transporter substrate-binding protein [Spiroplasma syrphidicola]AGM25879.1 phosphate ABC transporter substrate-binding protein [Spiroplasma syrphidicola EA-1]